MKRLSDDINSARYVGGSGKLLPEWSKVIGRETKKDNCSGQLSSCGFDGVHSVCAIFTMSKVCDWALASDIVVCNAPFICAHINSWRHLTHVVPTFKRTSRIPSLCSRSRCPVTFPPLPYTGVSAPSG